MNTRPTPPASVSIDTPRTPHGGQHQTEDRRSRTCPHPALSFVAVGVVGALGALALSLGAPSMSQPDISRASIALAADITTDPAPADPSTGAPADPSTIYTDWCWHSYHNQRIWAGPVTVGTAHADADMCSHAGILQVTSLRCWTDFGVIGQKMEIRNCGAEVRDDTAKFDVAASAMIDFTGSGSVNRGPISGSISTPFHAGDFSGDMTFTVGVWAGAPHEEFISSCGPADLTRCDNPSEDNGGSSYRKS